MDGDLVVQRPQGLYCPAGDFYIDPWRRVERAVITHAHADHARAGHGHYLATAISEGVLRERLGPIEFQGLAYGQAVEHRGVRISLHPAGHVLGSAQVRLEHGGQVWVVSGDYKTTPEPTCTPLEPQRCDVFITESTFGLPLYRWRADADVFADINHWWAANAALGRPSVLYGYSLGKAQRLLAGVDAGIGPIACHGAVQTINRAYRQAGVALPDTRTLESLQPQERRRALLLCPPGAAAGAWLRRLGDASEAFASGWMQLRGMRRRAGHARGFALSDHADWPGLLGTIDATGAQRVIVTHGNVAVLVRYLCEQGLSAESFDTEYGDTEQEAGAA